MTQVGFAQLTPSLMALALQFKSKGYHVVGFDEDRSIQQQASASGIEIVSYLEDLSVQVKSKRVIWIDIEAEAFQDFFERFMLYLSVGDVMVDISDIPGNEMRLRYQQCQALQIDLLRCDLSLSSDNDVQISGNRFTFNFCEGIFRDVSRKNYRYTGLI